MGLGFVFSTVEVLVAFCPDKFLFEPVFFLAAMFKGYFVVLRDTKLIVYNLFFEFSAEQV